MYLAFSKATVKIMSTKCTSPLIHGEEIFACFMLISDVPARLGLKAAALAWLLTALAFKIWRLGQSRQ
jgi:hypothetical protein